MRLRAALGLLGALALVVALTVLLRPPAAEPGAPSSVDPTTGLQVVSLASLPVEAQDTVRRIDRGGPFPYVKDGSVFGNRERLLPIQPDGYYASTRCGRRTRPIAARCASSAVTAAPSCSTPPTTT